MAIHDDIQTLERALARAREMVDSTAPVVKYDNGGGQSGIRKNPAYEMYMSLLNSYIHCLEAGGADEIVVENRLEALRLPALKEEDED